MEKEYRVKVLPCDCEHIYQDRKYGKGKRLHNQTKDGEWRCSVCRKEKR